MKASEQQKFTRTLTGTVCEAKSSSTTRETGKNGNNYKQRGKQYTFFSFFKKKASKHVAIK